MPESLVKQNKNKSENPMNLNPTGRGGFGDHPDHINKNGRPKLGNAISDVIRGSLDDEIDIVDKKTGQIRKITKREALSEVLLKLGISGNLRAIELIMDRLEGKPRQSIKHEGDINSRIEVLNRMGLLDAGEIEELEGRSSETPGD